MGSRALDGLDALASHGKPKKPVKKPKVVSKPVEVEEIQDSYVVRVPRTTPASKANGVAQFSGADTLLDRAGLAKGKETEERREKILAWMLNGHLHDGSLCTPSDLSVALCVPLKTVQNDIAQLKEQMGEFSVNDELKDAPALAHMLMEMKFQDRGRALALYNIIMMDINKADAETLKLKTQGQTLKGSGAALTGRDRAAMYSAALTALDLSNKATNGMDQLFKLTGGAQRLQNIIKTKNLTINNGPVYSFQQLQDFVATEMGAVLPSTRKVDKKLEAPKSITLDAEDLAILETGNKK